MLLLLGYVLLFFASGGLGLSCCMQLLLLYVLLLLFVACLLKHLVFLKDYLTDNVFFIMATTNDPV